MVDVGRSSRQCFADDLGNLPQRLLEFGILRGILLRERRDFMRRFVCILIQGKRASIGGQRRHADFGRDPPEPVLFQLHVAHDLRLDRPGRVCQGRTTKPGVKLIGNRGSADLSSALEHKRFVSCLGKIERGDQPVVSAANDDDIAPLRHVLCRSLNVF